MKTLRQLGIFEELVIDNFAGGGGASTGIEAAIGRPIDIAINHDPEAIAMHRANHPFTKHYCESVWEVDPTEATGGRPVGLAWFSPDCKHFSKAKGGQLKRSKEIRGLAWVALKWAAKVRPRVMFLENVEEFLTWGPLNRKGEIIKERKGETFNQYIKQWRALGYNVEWRILCAADYGAPTTRKRLFIIARRDGKPIVWPKPTHSKDGKVPGTKKWRTAAEIIDWSLPVQSIFERKKPLADATLRRIARGVVKFVIENKRPFIVTCNHQGDEWRGVDLEDAFPTVTASRDAHGVVVPTLIQTGYGEHSKQAPRVPGLDKPLGTVMAEGIKHALIAPSLVQYNGEKEGTLPRCGDIDAPLNTVTAGGYRHALAVAFLLRHYGGYAMRGEEVAASELTEPTATVTSKDHHNLVTAHMIRHFGTGIGSSMDEPARTVMTEGAGKSGMVQAFLQQYNGSEGTLGTELDEPLNTATVKDRFALVTIESVEYVIVDIGMRMLKPHELFAAQGFPADYEISPMVPGKKKPKALSQSAQTRMCGNSVCPPLAEALVRANYKELKARKRA